MRFVGHAYQPHLPIAVCMLSSHVQKTDHVLVGKGCQQMSATDNRHSSLRYDAAQAHGVCALESSSVCSNHLNIKLIVFRLTLVYMHLLLLCSLLSLALSS